MWAWWTLDLSMKSALNRPKQRRAGEDRWLSLAGGRRRRRRYVWRTASLRAKQRETCHRLLSRLERLPPMAFRA
jgi:hypothetical protein